MKRILLVLVLGVLGLQAMEPGTSDAGLRHRVTQSQPAATSITPENPNHIMDTPTERDVIAKNKLTMTEWAKKSRFEHLREILREDTALVSVCISHFVFGALLYYCCQMTQN